MSAQKEQITILWFKRDLRIEDHPPFAMRRSLDIQYPLYVVEPALWMQSDYSGRQWEFTKECLFDLRAQLGAVGMPLVVRVGGVRKVLSELAATFDVKHLVAHEETGTAWTFQRDLRVQAWCRENAIECIELPHLVSCADWIRAITGRVRGIGLWMARA